MTVKLTTATTPTAKATETARENANTPNRENTRASRDFRNTPQHNFLDETYNANGGYAGRANNADYSYIIANPTENFFRTRVRMSVYLNDFKQYINAKFEPIFKDIAKSYAMTENGTDMPNHVFLDFVNNVSGSGVNKNEFLRMAIRQTYIHDVCFLIMDKTYDNLQPYLYYKAVQDVLNYTVDNYGALNSITFCDGQEKTKTGATLYRRRYIGLDKWAIKSQTTKKHGAK